MQATKQILSAVLVVAVLFSGLPLFSPEDANRDHRLDLEDTILKVRELVQSAEKPDNFGASMQKAVAALQLMAGLKTVIKADSQTKSSCNFFNLDLHNLIFSFNLLLQTNTSFEIVEKESFFKSYSIIPSTPPPQVV